GAGHQDGRAEIQKRDNLLGPGPQGRNSLKNLIAPASRSPPLMRSLVATLMLCVALLALLIPSAVAVPTFVIKDVSILDADGHKLVFIPQNDFVKIRVTLNNTG